MISFKKFLKYIVILSICSFCINTFAADQAAKEETSPPVEDGPLTADQVPPINKM